MREFIGQQILFWAACMLVVMVGWQPAQATVASEQEMDRVSENWLTQVVYDFGSWAGSDDPEVTYAEELKSGDTVLARCYHISPSGFVLVPVLKEMMPVKLYSEHSGFDVGDDGGMVQLVREVLSERLSAYVELYGSLDAEQPTTGELLFARSQSAQWDKLTVSHEQFVRDVGMQRVQSPQQAGPLLTSSWNQGPPYNDLCPEGDGGTCVVGCVATAAAQILYYWQWPASGFGSYSYTWDGDQSCGGDVGGGLLTADFSDPYDWANMIDSVDLGYTTAQGEALAELNYETGVAFDMNYGVCGSGASVSRATTVFSTFYKYSPEIRRVNRADYDQAGWYGLVQEEIDNSRPIQYRINMHSIVCDGYREQGGQYEYHMNYGWAGNSTAWYVLDSLYCYWITGEVCPYEEEFMITHIYPQTEPVIVYYGQVVAENSGDGDGHADPGESMSLSVDIVNRGWDATNTTGTLSTDDSYISIDVSSADFESTIVWGDTGTTQSAFEFSVSPSCPDPHIAVFVLEVSCDGGYSITDTLRVFVGDTPGFEDMMESGEGYWTHSPVTPAYNDQWHLETSRAYSGVTSWKAGGTGTGNYADVMDAGLVTPPFLLPINATLSFWHWMDAEIDAEPGMAWDGAVVMISSGDGVWTQITPSGGYPYAIVPNVASPFEPYTPCYSGSHSWTMADFDLSAYSGVVQIMFRFGSDGYVNQEGWYIDDVSVTSAGCCVGLTGNVDNDPDDICDIGDLTELINFLFITFEEPVCMEEANTDGLGSVDMGDLTKLIGFLFIPPYTPTAPCP
ncbi:MAG: C10 family peptidase [Candidatus Zixiibacteriota bacterium]|nr:MAG: C10 family peptidase [candidate division Zixibacteria bacterium]